MNTQNLKLQDIIMAAVAITVCIAFLAVIGLAFLGKVDAQQIVTFVFTAVTGLLSGTVAWIGATQKERARTEGVLSVLKAEGR